MLIRKYHVLIFSGMMGLQLYIYVIKKSRKEVEESVTIRLHKHRNQGNTLASPPPPQYWLRLCRY